MHPLLLKTLAQRYVHVRCVPGPTLDYARSLGEVFESRFGEDPIVTMKIEGENSEVTRYASCRTAELSLHTDYATFAVPPRFTVSHCIEPDPRFPEFGRSIVILLDKVLEHLRTNEPALDRLLRTRPMPFRRNAEHDSYHAEVPAFTVLDECDRVRFDSTLIVPALEAGDLPDRAELIDAALRFEELCHTYGERVEVPLARNGVLICDNHKVVHSRSSCTVELRDGEQVSREVNLVFLR